MNFYKIPSGQNIPHDIYVIIEIAANSSPIKYEINKEIGAIFVDRFLLTPMFYPCNYGYINKTLSLDGDPIDVLVPTPYPLLSGCVILCRPVGILNMIDESGEDSKIIAVPHNKISKKYDHIKKLNDLPDVILNQIEYFFTHYKDLDSEKWIKIKNWEDLDYAKKEILCASQRYINQKLTKNK